MRWDCEKQRGWHWGGGGGLQPGWAALAVLRAAKPSPDEVQLPVHGERGAGVGNRQRRHHQQAALPRENLSPTRV